jgi:hypothetical protein
VAGVSAGGTGATTANAALVAEEERMLRRYLTAAVSDSMAMSALTSTQTASLLYRSGHKRAAKELLCEQRQIYAEFQRTPWPCSPRTEAELRRIDPAPAPAANAPPSFQQNNFRSRADCLTAAYTSGVPLNSCTQR